MPLNDFRSVFMPYCLRKQEDGTYVVLNREYKPIGFKTKETVDYKNYPICVHLKGIGPSTASKLSCNGSNDVKNIYLYDDGCIPTASSEYMKSYLSKLELLAKLKIE